MEQRETSPLGTIHLNEPSEPDRSSIGTEPAPLAERGHAPDLGAEPAPRREDLSPEQPAPTAEAAASAEDASVLPDQPSVRRGLIYLAICIAFAVALILPNMFGSAASRPPAPCNEGAVLSQVLAVPGQAGAAPYLLAIVRPQPFPNIAPGDESGCDALYRSDDSGSTWTVSFSATAEAPTAVAWAGASGQLYLLTQRMHFPLYLAGNVYHSGEQAIAWSWARVSPQARSDVPMVSATAMLVMDDGSVILREGNGDGAALVITRDEGNSWQPLVIPRLTSVGSMATLGNQIAVTLPRLAPGQAPGMVSDDHGASWRSMGTLPDAPPRTDLRPVLSADLPEHVLVLDLVPDSVVGPGGSLRRYYSRDGGQRWLRVRCGVQPAPGCAVAARWSQAAGIRYVLYRGQVYQAAPDRAWTPLRAPLPAASDSVLQLLAVADGRRPVLYLVNATGIWRWDGAAWQPYGTGLPLGPPPPARS
ncbi:MAG TPA: hypothetical protein VHB98_07750 [Chloroflexota bacterium]|nr:hypothetical protein [Chloroflexota bacterium]